MAAPYPITIEKIVLEYKSGTSDKEYHFVHIHAAGANGKSILIKRYNRRNSWGQMDVILSDAGSTRAAMEKRMKEALGKGYSQRNRASMIVNDEVAFRAQVGTPYMAKLTSVQLRHVFGDDSFGSAVADLEELAGGAIPKRKSAAPAEPKAKPVTTADTNPNWGAFS